MKIPAWLSNFRSTATSQELENQTTPVKFHHEDSCIDMTDDGNTFTIKQKKNEAIRPKIRLFTEVDTEKQVLEFFDVESDDIYYIDQPDLRRDNFSEMDKVIPVFSSEHEAKACLENLSDYRSLLEFKGIEFLQSSKLTLTYPLSFLQQVYNLKAGQDDYVSSFFEPKTVSFKEVTAFINFFDSDDKQSIYQATLNSRSAVASALSESPSKKSKPEENEDLEFALDLSTPAFEGYLGYNELVGSSKSMVNRFLNGANLARYSKKPQKDKLSILLYGPPGTGKTQFMIELYKYATQLIQSTHQSKKTVKLFKLAKTDFGSEYHNKSENNLQAYLDKIEKYLDANENNFALFFIDEVDEIAAQRVQARSASDKSDNSIITILLKCLSDKRKLRRTIFVCATNFYDNLDNAFKRPGRFDQTYHMGYLNCSDSIEKLFYINLESKQFNLETKPSQFKQTITALSQLMAQTQTSTPAEIASIIDHIKTRIDQRVEEMESSILEQLKAFEEEHDLQFAQSQYLTIVNDLWQIEDIMEAFYATYPKIAQQAKALKQTQVATQQTDDSDFQEAGYFLTPLDDSEFPIYEIEANPVMQIKLAIGGEYVASKQVRNQLLSALPV